jgi:hypothetical protein
MEYNPELGCNHNSLGHHINKHNSVYRYVFEQNRRVDFCKPTFSQRKCSKKEKKYGLHFFGGHLGTMAAIFNVNFIQNDKFQTNY